MSSSKKFDKNVLYKKLNEYFGENTLKLVQKTENKILILTKSDRFYEININDANIPSFILKNDKSVIESMINKNLCNERIIDLTYCCDRYIARTDDNKFYFENGLKNTKLNEALSGLKINAIKCGSRHTLVLTSSGEIYAWGDNRYGQIG